MMEATARMQIDSISAETSSAPMCCTSFDTPDTPTSSSVRLRDEPAASMRPRRAWTGCMTSEASNCDEAPAFLRGGIEQGGRG